MKTNNLFGIWLLFLCATVHSGCNNYLLNGKDGDEEEDNEEVWYNNIPEGNFFSRGNTLRFYYIDEKGNDLINPSDLKTFPVSWNEELDNPRFYNKYAIFKTSDGKDATFDDYRAFLEDYTPDKFDKGNYQVLLVANKYQTGFDQPKLAAMYVLKKLSGISAVQTLSRLNRIYPPYNQKTFILDIVNTIDEIVKAYKPYYTTTLLCNTLGGGR